MINLQEIQFMTADRASENDPNYKVICELLSEMVRTGSIFLGAGYCISMSDMVRTALKHRGIDSKLIDCQATFTDIRNGPKGNGFIGYPNVINHGEIDTHVVVITSTTPAYLIDASLAKRLPEDRYAIVEPIKFNSDNQLTLINATYDDVKLKVTYQQKKTQVAGYHHQQSIVERIETDMKIKEDIHYLKVLNYIGITLGTFGVLNVFAKILGYWQNKMFKLTSLSAIGAKSLAKQYVRFGYKLISQKYDEKKQVYISTFK